MQVKMGDNNQIFALNKNCLLLDENPSEGRAIFALQLTHYASKVGESFSLTVQGWKDFFLAFKTTKCDQKDNRGGVQWLDLCLKVRSFPVVMSSLLVFCNLNMGITEHEKSFLVFLFCFGHYIFLTVQLTLNCLQTVSKRVWGALSI